MKKVKGRLLNANKSIIGRICYKNNILIKNRILVSDRVPLCKVGLKAIVSSKQLRTTLPVFICDKKDFINGDIVNISLDGDCSVVWQENAEHNAFYVTDVCNSKCIMCPQVESNKSYYDVCDEILETLRPNQLNYVGITGGEPTLNIDKLCNLVSEIVKKSNIIPEIHILTNGRMFKDIEDVKKISSIKNCNITFGIPLYSSIAEEHDYITGVDGSFVETIEGLYNLAKYMQKIELRVVLLRQNYKRLNDLVEFIYRNLPFVVHIAFMGMEYRGRAESNFDEVSIDAIEYKSELFNAVKNCVRRKLNADIYNLPFCLVDERLEDYCRDSISEWKKIYLPKCEGCIKKEKCSGMFETSFVQSENIKAVVE